MGVHKHLEGTVSALQAWPRDGLHLKLALQPLVGLLCSALLLRSLQQDGTVLGLCAQATGLVEPARQPGLAFL